MVFQGRSSEVNVPFKASGLKAVVIAKTDLVCHRRGIFVLQATSRYP
jgi:hypothetical protein